MWSGRAIPKELKKYRFSEETIQKLLEKQWWNAAAAELKKVKEMEFRVGEYVGERMNALRTIED